MSHIAILVASILAADGPNDKTCCFSGKPVDPATLIMSEGKRVGFCCKKCLARFTSKHENKLSDEQRGGSWKLLFNGKDLDGFRKSTRDGKWSVRDGILVGTGGRGVLATKESFGDFVLTADVRISDSGVRRGNSGIFIRSTGLTAFRGRWPDGHEIQIDHGDPEFWTGSIFRERHARKVDVKDGEWLSMKIEAAGPRIRVWVNGMLVSDSIITKPVVKGPISLQVHHETDLVELKNLKVLALESA